MKKSRRIFFQYFFSFCFLAGNSFFNPLQAGNYNIIPAPANIIPQQGSFTFNANTVVVCNPAQTEVFKLAQQFAQQLETVTGMKLMLKSQPGDTTNAVVFQQSVMANPEAYELIITPRTIRIRAGAPNGFFYGLQTLYQLLPVQIYGRQRVNDIHWIAPAVSISDAPRFSYRGLHLDVSRHFFPVEFIKKYIDAMAIHKLNTFHWHLTDDQGWRIEIKKHPRLTEVGSVRKETLIGHFYEHMPQRYDGKPYGGFYTQDEAREIVKYASERFITVVPEIEMPGHAQAALAAYPFLGCKKDPSIEVATKWGIFKEVFCPTDSTFRFLEDVLTEVMDIFPSKYIHIGGDECPKDNWKKCAHCQEMIKKHNLKDEHGLQSYFITRMEKFVNSKGRRIIGWDEIMEGGLAPNATVMSWRGTKGGIAAAKSRHHVVMTPTDFCYLDYYQADPQNEPTAIGGYVPLKKVYDYEPVPAELTAEEAKYILGVQANLWTEYMPTSQHVEYMAYPRVAALAETAWSSTGRRNWDDFRGRMLTQFGRYEQLNINASRAFFDVRVESQVTSGRQLVITLAADHPGVQIRYSINGKEIDYSKPFILERNSEISATAYLNGLPAGRTVKKSFVVSRLTGLGYKKNMHHTWYTGGSTNALTDGVTGNTKAYTQWMAISGGVDGEIVVDMLKVQPVSRFSIGLLSAPALCVQVSPHIRLSGSVDGKKFTLLAEQGLPAPTAPTWEMFRPELNFKRTQARFLKIELQNAGICPSDRPHGGVGSMLFMDEIGAW